LLKLFILRLKHIHAKQKVLFRNRNLTSIAKFKAT